MHYNHAFLVASREYIENVHTRGFWLGALGMPVLFLIFSISPMLLAGAESEAKYAVIDRSGWIHDAAQLAITRNDIDQLFDVLAERTPDEIDTGVLLEIAELIGDPDDRQEFATVSTRLIHTLRVENASVSNPQALHERFAAWWASSTAQIIAAAPNVSFAQYIEVVAPSIERARLNAMVENQELLGYFVIPDDPVATTEGAQYITKNLTNRSLQNWYADVVTKVVQMQRIREEGIASETAKEIQAPVGELRGAV